MKRKRNAKMDTNETKEAMPVASVFDTKAFEAALKAEVKAAGGTKEFCKRPAAHILFLA